MIDHLHLMPDTVPGNFSGLIILRLHSVTGLLMALILENNFETTFI